MRYLYHYTNINALKSILENKTIRLRPLSTMDDVEEALSVDCKAIGNFVFVSSWSEVSEESIPMWSMYGDKYRGVRIGLPENPFRQYTYSERDQMEYGLFNTHGNLTVDLPLDDIVNEQYLVSPFHSEAMLKRVQYTEEQDRLIPKLWSKQDNIKELSYGKMGQYKNCYWSFQKEYRYLLYLFPVSIKMINNLIQLGMHQALEDILRDILDGKVSCPFEHYDLHIASDIIEKMEIITGPLMEEEDFRKVTDYAGAISNNILVKRSALKGKIRGA